ncbi:hypothetical protein SU69_08470 [Thermosipho melanesiensis]|uniref:CRISPR system Cms protein Csm2 n=2 Tax=Thermosipho melanesiensis TaxID=46541 RepID=A6LNL3_THEM4|nr:type III-A CRISPR-associated protein Csm2 [Thermosipho melanesiensis]ABR31514.1 CRISPR-associated protein, Csm2 family [Thermosipho melanesiensis BI429]APT74937.1 hypothetical protein BW47_08845 [Thermosipho melanesiensis]OOC35262.1 hypothetical protein SU69_08470 [Thermosipho melanesiensis]OOC35481.1 hypothetical protein SU70_08480 [Thermosipho melanesiensis]OOC36517.1 hypothetical protein SU68_08535 [Thermosipho melanesiensis]
MRNDNFSRQRNSQKEFINQELAEKILNPDSDPDGENLFEYSKEISKEIKVLSSTQLRKYYDEVKKIPNNKDYKYHLKRFIAVFLYSVNKIKNKKNKEVVEKFSESIKNLALVASNNDERYFKRFRDFFEALVAYHTYYKNNNNNKE